MIKPPIQDTFGILFFIQHLAIITLVLDFYLYIYIPLLDIAWPSARALYNDNLKPSSRDGRRSSPVRDGDS